MTTTATQLTPEAEKLIRGYMFKIFVMAGGAVSIFTSIAGFLIRDVAISRADAQASSRVLEDVAKMARESQMLQDRLSSYNKSLDDRFKELTDIENRINNARTSIVAIEKGDTKKAADFVKVLNEADGDVKQLFAQITEVAETIAPITSGKVQLGADGQITATRFALTNTRAALEPFETGARLLLSSGDKMSVQVRTGSRSQVLVGRDDKDDEAFIEFRGQESQVGANRLRGTVSPQ